VLSSPRVFIEASILHSINRERGPSPARDHLQETMMTVVPNGTRLRRVSLTSRIVERPEVGAAIGLLIVWVFFAILGRDSGFLTERGTSSYLGIAAEVGIISTSVTLLLIAGEFDLSIGSMVGFSGMIIALGTTQGGWPLWLAIAVALAFALVYGLGVGMLVVRVGVPSFIITLAGLFLLRGATIGFSRTIAQQPYIGGVKKAIGGDPLQYLFSGDLFGSIDKGFAWWLIVVAVASIVLTKTVFGNWIFAVGGSPTAARASGVPVARVKIILFMSVAASGVLLATIQVLSLGSADSFRGQGKEFEAAITAVIGGTALSGGRGSVIGTAIGALTLGVVRQGLFFAGVDYDWYQSVLGLMLLAAVLINHYARRNAQKT
jgi:simple sugar transport system permease protein